MNGVIGIARATAQDDRAIEAANAAFFNYGPLSSWDSGGEYLYGELEMLLPCGVYGGEIKNYPKAEFLLKKVLKVENADELAEIMGSVGLANNIAALSMISTIGLQEGHEPHRKKLF
jgi:hydroxymethylglutaryl-CoA reductase